MTSKLTTRMRLQVARPADRWVLAPIVAMAALGTLMIYSVTFGETFREGGSSSYYLLRHLQWLLVGSGALFVCSRIDYHSWRRFSVPLMAAALLGLIIVVFAPESISPMINGARRWLRFGPLSAQPSEFAKLAFVIYAADWLSQKGEKVRNLWYGLVPFGIMLGVIVGLVELEPDLGTSLVFVIIGGCMFFVAGAHLMQLFGGAGLAVGAFLVLILSASYRLSRLSIFLDPWRDPSNLGYQPIQSILALGSGGLTGLGLGVSRQKFGWLPEAHTDSIMAVVGEELGFVGGLVVIALIATLAVRGCSIARRSPDSFGALLATGITAWIVGQSTLNIAVITLTVPFTGIPLPFISYGGSSLVVLMAVVGILMNISRHTLPEKPGRARGRRRRSARAEARQVSG
ncbi:MAG: putative lipid II flippase FtsW [Chloroflexota bacterium]|nr:putative lipid II flippase FtsW [Chloroflexota bacterium]